MNTPLPGIYNYCFRWCERCPFTDRCRTYATGVEMGAERPGGHHFSAAFPALSGNFADFLTRLERLNLPAGTDDLASTSTPDDLATLGRTLTLHQLREGDVLNPLLHRANFSLPSVQAAHTLAYYASLLGSS